MHKPVLLKEAIDLLNVRKGLMYIDCTVGLGGHSIEILERLDQSGNLIGLDQDKNILNITNETLKDYKNCYLFHSNFVNLPNLLKEQNIEKISGGVLLDLGVNSIHLDSKERGFSFNASGPLDMRMDLTCDLTAYKIINTYSENDLADIIYKYGEDRFSRRIARVIIEFRKNKPIKTTEELAALILKCYHQITKKPYFKPHPATRTFQAIRIEVNKELENLEKFLCFIPELLLPGSRLSVISFHSLEDRIIKNFLKNNQQFKTLTKKPIIPSADELKTNPRSRSAKLRSAEKI